MMQITFFDALKDGFSEKTTFRVGVDFLFLTSHFLFSSRLNTLSFNSRRESSIVVSSISIKPPLKAHLALHGSFFRFINSSFRILLPQECATLITQIPANCLFLTQPMFLKPWITKNPCSVNIPVELFFIFFWAKLLQTGKHAAIW